MVRKIQGDVLRSKPVAEEPGSNVRVLRGRELGRSFFARDGWVGSAPVDSGLLVRPRLSITACPRGGLGVAVAGTPSRIVIPRA